MQHRRIRIAAVATLFLLPSMFITSQADAGVPAVRLRVSKNPNGPFKHTLNQDLAAGDVKNYYLEAKNTTGSLIDAELRRSFSDAGYDTKYFRKNDNISNDVEGTGYHFPIKGGKVKHFRLRVKRQVVSNATGCTFTELNIMNDREDAAGISFNAEGECP